MRTAVIFFLSAALGCVYLYQKRHEQPAPRPTTVTAQEAAAPRPVSEHNWAKHALDSTAKVTRQVAKERKENEIPK